MILTRLERVARREKARQEILKKNHSHRIKSLIENDKNANICEDNNFCCHYYLSVLFMSERIVAYLKNKDCYLKIWQFILSYGIYFFCIMF